MTVVQLIFMHGPIASGKLTTARVLAAATSGERR